MIKKFWASHYMSAIKKIIDQVKAQEVDNQVQYRWIGFANSGKPKIQLVGKMISFEASFNGIVDGGLLLGFSKQEAIFITHMVEKLDPQAEPLPKPKYRFKGLIPSISAGPSKIIVETEQGTQEQWPCAEALTNTDLVSTASDQQKVEAGYIAGYEECNKKRANIQV